MGQFWPALVDIDLSFILPGNRFDLKPEDAAFVGAFHLFLGDLSFVVGHATDCVGGRLAKANEDPLTKTSLITTRFIGGDPLAYEQLQARFVKECIAGQEDQGLRSQPLRHIQVAICVAGSR